VGKEASEEQEQQGTTEVTVVSVNSVDNNEKRGGIKRGKAISVTDHADL
jgi:hypothetical protein